jgi:3-hydroxyisobutyrate dehydrogenase
MEQTTIAFIGVGIMGKGIVNNLKKTKSRLKLYARNPNKIKDLEDVNTKVCNSILEAVQSADFVILCLTEDHTVRHAVFQIKLFENFSGILLDFGTTSPELTEEIHLAATSHKIPFLDSPMTGSKKAAASGEIIYMVGYEKEEDFRKCQFIWESTGKKIIPCGKVGNGQKTKIALNLVQAGVLQMYMEGLVLAKKLGISPEVYYETITNSAARSGISDFKLDCILKENFETNFSLKNMNKDVNHALNLSNQQKVSLPLSYALKSVYNSGMSAGLGEYDFCSLIRINEKMNNSEFPA